MVKLNTDNINHLANFWELNPTFMLYKPFDALYKEDKSKDKVESSKVMWFIFFMTYPDEDLNIFYRVKEEVRRTMLMETLAPKVSDDIDTLLSQFTNLCLTTVQKTLKEEIEQLVKRADLIKNTELTLDRSLMDANGKMYTEKGTATQINLLQKDSLKIYESYEKIRNKFLEEKTVARGKAGIKLTRVEEDENFFDD